MSAPRSNVRVTPETPRDPSRAPVAAATSKVRAEPSPRWAPRFLALWTVAVLATGGAFVAHLALRFETVRLGYEVGAARRIQSQLVEQRRLLSLEGETLRQAARVETVARGSLNMDVPGPERVVPVSARGAQRAAGRVR